MPRAVLVFWFWGLGSLAGTDLPSAESTEFFERRIRPMLVEHCYPCHAATSTRIRGGFLLDTREGIRRGGNSGKPAIVPGAPAQSTLLEAVRRTDPDRQMPPETVLPPEAIADLEAWILQGAPDPREEDSPAKNLPPSRDPARHWAFHPPRDTPPPQVQDRPWIRTPVDRFILNRLEQEGRRPSPEADPRTLIRRVTVDLWGLPPKPEEVEAFLQDKAPDAFERLVDRLLASPHYGERWGRHWLDIARYADTKGYVYYYEESRFVHPEAYRDWVIDAFNEDLPYDRFLMLQIAGDQLGTARGPDTASAGVSTLRNHTPIHDRSVAALGFLTLGRRFLDLEPDIIDDRIDVTMRGTQALTVGCARCHDHKFDPISTRDYYALYGIFQGSEERLVPIESPMGSEATAAFDSAAGQRLAQIESRFLAASEEVANRLRARSRDYLVAVLDVARLPADANVRPQPDDLNPFNVRQWERAIAGRDPSDPVFAAWHAFARLPAEGFAAAAAALSDRWRDPQTHLPRLNPRVAELLEPPPTSMAVLAARYGDLFAHIHQEWQRMLRETPEDQSPPTAMPGAHAEALRQVLYGPEAPVRVPPGQIVDLDVHLYFDDPNRVALAKLQMELEQWLITNSVAPRHAVVLHDRAHQVPAVVFRRGDPQQRGESVPRGFPRILAGPNAKPFHTGSGRLELARAIASPDNPLTARVLVNRVWARHFGQGLVRTPSDFGVRCDPPTHPELLDWLARRFMGDGWSIKRLHRLILTSSAYRQAAPTNRHDPSGEAFSTDPENRLLGRQSRRPLDFEAFRDALLAITGDLDTRMGGPASVLDQRPFSQRRSVYGWIDRRQLPGMLRAFDFANPDVHSPQRYATITPQQALFLLNHPFLPERARALAGRLAGLPPTDLPGRIERLYVIALQRRPTPDESDAAQAYLQAAAADPPTGPMDPWAELAQTVLLSNEFMFLD